jgi:hypothetical protein
MLVKLLVNNAEVWPVILFFRCFSGPGGLMGDVWDSIPEDFTGRNQHFAPYPAALFRTPILQGLSLCESRFRPWLLPQNGSGTLFVRPFACFWKTALERRLIAFPAADLQFGKSFGQES